MPQPIAARFDDVLYDHVGRPEGKLTQTRLPGLTTTPERAIAGFLAGIR